MVLYTRSGCDGETNTDHKNNNKRDTKKISYLPLLEHQKQTCKRVDETVKSTTKALKPQVQYEVVLMHQDHINMEIIRITIKIHFLLRRNYF